MANTILVVLCHFLPSEPALNSQSVHTTSPPTSHAVYLTIRSHWPCDTSQVQCSGIHTDYLSKVWLLSVYASWLRSQMHARGAVSPGESRRAGFPPGSLCPVTQCLFPVFLLSSTLREKPVPETLWGRLPSRQCSQAWILMLCPHLSRAHHPHSPLMNPFYRLWIFMSPFNEFDNVRVY